MTDEDLVRAASAYLEARLKELHSEATRVDGEITWRRSALLDAWLRANPGQWSDSWPLRGKPLDEIEAATPGFAGIYKAERTRRRRAQGLCEGTCRKCPDWCTKKGKHRVHECSTHVGSGP